jgi:purine nucleosidase
MLLSMMKLVLLLFLIVGSVAAQSIPVTFDTDIGDAIEDALALALALQSPELNIKAVTTVVDRAALRSRLAWKEMALYGRQDIPIATGTDEPLLHPVHSGHFAQFAVLTAGDVVPGPPRCAVDLIISTILGSPQKVTVIAVGPLTNVTLALRIEPRIKNNIERIVLMGGAYYIIQTEYNIYRDRIAAEIVFSSGLPITAVGLDVTRQCKLTSADIEALKQSVHPSGPFSARLIDPWNGHRADQLPTLHDPLAVAVAVRASMFAAQRGRVQVETASPLLYGLTLFTPRDRVPKGAAGDTLVAHDVVPPQFSKFFMERLTPEPKKKER